MRVRVLTCVIVINFAPGEIRGSVGVIFICIIIVILVVVLVVLVAVLTEIVRRPLLPRRTRQGILSFPYIGDPEDAQPVPRPDFDIHRLPRTIRRCRGASGAPVSGLEESGGRSWLRFLAGIVYC